jgi:pimeloyl-ACP methyl ester carboxylesterase
VPGAWRDFDIDAGGYALAVRDYGGRGTPLILVHGNGLNVCEWDLVAPRLAERFRVAAFDVRGYGRSEFPGTWSEPYRDIERVATALDLQRPTLLTSVRGDRR